MDNFHYNKYPKHFTAAQIEIGQLLLVRNSDTFSINLK